MKGLKIFSCFILLTLLNSISLEAQDWTNPRTQEYYSAERMALLKEGDIKAIERSLLSESQKNIFRQNRTKALALYPQKNTSQSNQGQASQQKNAPPKPPRANKVPGPAVQPASSSTSPAVNTPMQNQHQALPNRPANYKTQVITPPSNTAGQAPAVKTPMQNQNQALPPRPANYNTQAITSPGNAVSQPATNSASPAVKTPMQNQNQALPQRPANYNTQAITAPGNATVKPPVSQYDAVTSPLNESNSKVPQKTSTAPRYDAVTSPLNESKGQAPPKPPKANKVPIPAALTPANSAPPAASSPMQNQHQALPNRPANYKTQAITPPTNTTSTAPPGYTPGPIKAASPPPGKSQYGPAPAAVNNATQSKTSSSNAAAAGSQYQKAPPPADARKQLPRTTNVKSGLNNVVNQTNSAKTGNATNGATDSGKKNNAANPNKSTTTQGNKIQPKSSTSGAGKKPKFKKH